jgi:hypothetical protein
VVSLFLFAITSISCLTHLPFIFFPTSILKPEYFKTAATNLSKGKPVGPNS